MKKKRYYVIVILLLSFIFIGEVNADTCDYLADRSWGDTNGNFTTASTPGYNQISKEFTSPISIPNGYSYIKIPMYIVLTSTNNTISNINLGATCSKVTQPLEGYDSDYTITYQDGSTANVSGEELNTICEEYVVTGGNATLPYEPEIQNIVLRLTYPNNGVLLCDLDANLMATCKLPNNYNNLTITGYRFAYTLNKNSSTVQGGFASILFGLCKDSDKEIIEQQQETNDKLNDIQNNDISSESKESPNTDDYDDYQNAENSLFDKMEQADTSNLNVAIDGNSANFVWDTITRFYNSNALLMNFLISILSIGIIKMALGR